MSAATINLPFVPGADNAGALRSFALAAVVHCVLFGFLYFGIRWQSQPPDIIAAELWTPVQTVPAPTPDTPRVETRPEPKPEVTEEPKPLPKPDIAEKIEKKKIEPKKETPKPRIEDDPIKRDLMKEQIARDMQRETVAQAAARDASTLADRTRKGWEARIAEKVRSRVRLPDNLAGNPEAVFEVSLLPTSMEVLSVKLVKSSGIPAYDEAAERAINASSPLPPPPAGVDPGRVLRFPFRPKN